jgi:hypothetical protein
MEEDGESKVAKIKVGDNFVIVVDELENVDPFFVILCDHDLHQCEATFQDEWGNIWYKGDMLLGGIWTLVSLYPRIEGSTYILQVVE